MITTAWHPTDQAWIESLLEPHQNRKTTPVPVVDLAVLAAELERARRPDIAIAAHTATQQPLSTTTQRNLGFSRLNRPRP